MDTIDSQTNYIVAAPSEPTDKTLTKKLSLCVADIEEVREAHLPAVIGIGGDSEARLTFFVVVRQDTNKERVRTQLARNMDTPFIRSSQVDFKVVADDFPLLESIRSTGCIVGWRD